jgi:Ca2+-binding RTX toxin-like protein
MLLSALVVASLCLPLPGVQCSPGNGRHTPGGHGSVSHAGWPDITGVLATADGGGRRETGSGLNDELLGGNGSDTLVGGAGDDVLWGDKNPVGNDSRQHDVLWGGSGDDWLYTSHGFNAVHAGPGNDHVWAYYGHGTIDCGSGHDVVRVRANGAYRLRGCEVVGRF